MARCASASRLRPRTNDVSASDAGFAVDTNRVTILDRDGGVEELPLLSKYDVSVRILDRVVPLLAPRG
jgi:phosphopantothenoylcysteine decarboxylase/phosphopantothenate--cysteine ligase